MIMVWGKAGTVPEPLDQSCFSWTWQAWVKVKICRHLDWELALGRDTDCNKCTWHPLWNERITKNSQMSECLSVNSIMRWQRFNGMLTQRSYMGWVSVLKGWKMWERLHTCLRSNYLERIIARLILKVKDHIKANQIRMTQEITLHRNDHTYREIPCTLLRESWLTIIVRL